MAISIATNGSNSEGEGEILVPTATIRSQRLALALVGATDSIGGQPVFALEPRERRKWRGQHPRKPKPFNATQKSKPLIA